MLNFADIVTSLPFETLEESLKQDSKLIHLRGYGGYTALHKAVLISNQPLALMLLQHGSDPNAITNSGDTSLHIACSRGSLQLVNTLMKYNGDLTVRNHCGHLPIHTASQNGNILVMQYLYEVHGCDIKSLDANGGTVLHTAAAGGHLDLVNYLVKVVSCLCLDKYHNTPLHSAAYGGVSGVCWAIICNGGDSLLLAKNKNEQTPLLVAQMSLSVSTDCKKWLERWMNDYTTKGVVSSPLSDWLMLLITPFFIFHISLILSIIATPERQWLLGISGFILLICILKNQHPRINHPVRWSNPIFVGAYGAGLFSTIICFIVEVKAPFNLAFLFVSSSLLSYTVLVYFFIKLLKGDPGTVPPTECLKETLIKLSENALSGQYCSLCARWAPPHSHHCRLCRKCYLVMDHHCLFLNKCVAEGNHWRFVIFVILNIVLTSTFLYSALSCNHGQEQFSIFSLDSYVEAVQFWARQSVWTGLLVLANLGSLLWGLSLFKFQFQVISMQQTTYNRLKAGTPVGRITLKQKIFNFLAFLYTRKLSLGHSNLYYEKV